MCTFLTILVILLGVALLTIIPYSLGDFVLHIDNKEEDWSSLGWCVGILIEIVIIVLYFLIHTVFPSPTPIELCNNIYNHLYNYICNLIN